MVVSSGGGGTELRGQETEDRPPASVSRSRPAASKERARSAHHRLCPFCGGPLWLVALPAPCQAPAANRRLVVSRVGKKFPVPLIVPIAKSRIYWRRVALALPN